MNKEQFILEMRHGANEMLNHLNLFEENKITLDEFKLFTNSWFKKGIHEFENDIDFLTFKKEKFKNGTLLTVGGIKLTCKCGCNVFTQSDQSDEYFKCNGCELIYEFDK